MESKLKVVLEAKKAELDEKYTKAIEELQAKKDAALSEIDNQLVLLKEDIDASFDEGVGQNTSPGDKIYSEADLQAELSPLKEQISQLQISAQESAVKIQELIDSKEADAVKAAQDFANYKTQIADELENAAIDNAAVVSKLRN